jgi:hypothetical protein
MSKPETEFGGLDASCSMTSAYQLPLDVSPFTMAIGGRGYADEPEIVCAILSVTKKLKLGCGWIHLDIHLFFIVFYF